MVLCDDVGQKCGSYPRTTASDTGKYTIIQKRIVAYLPLSFPRYSISAIIKVNSVSRSNPNFINLHFKVQNVNCFHVASKQMHSLRDRCLYSGMGLLRFFYRCGLCWPSCKWSVLNRTTNVLCFYFNIKVTPNIKSYAQVLSL